MADRDRASRVALRLGRRDPDWGGSCASRRAALDLEPSSPNPGSVRAHRSCSTRADRAGASCACSRISTVGLMRAEDERRLAPRRKRLARAPGASYSLIRNADCSVVASTTRSGAKPQVPPWILERVAGPPWRTALVHSLEYGAVRSNDLVSSFAVRHARLDAARQAHDVAELSSSL